MFIAALFIIAKIWQEHMFIDRCMDKESIEYLFNGTLFSSKKEKKKLPFVTTWMYLEVLH